MADLSVLQGIQDAADTGNAAITSGVGENGIATPTKPTAAINIPKPVIKASASTGNNSSILTGALKNATEFNSDAIGGELAEAQQYNGKFENGINVATGDVATSTQGNSYIAPVPQQDQPQQGWLDSAKNILTGVVQHPIKSLMSAAGTALGAVDASIAEVGNVITSPFTAAYLTLTDPNAAKNGYLSNFSNTFISGQGSVENYLHGNGSFTQLQIGQALTNYLNNRGNSNNGGDSNASGNATLGNVVNFVGNLLTSPSSYISAGVGGETKVATETGEVALSKAGASVFKDQVNAVLGATENLSKEDAQQIVKDSITSALANGKNEINGVMVDNMLDRGGLKIAGNTIPYTDRLAQGVESLGNVAKDVVMKIPGFQAAADTVKQMFVPVVDQVQNGIAKQIISKYSSLQGSIVDQLTRQIADLTKGLSDNAQEVIRYGRGNAELLAQLSPEERATADKIYGFLDEIGSQVKNADPSFEGIDNFMHQAYKETPEEIGQKLDQANADIQGKVAAGTPLTDDEQALKEKFDQGRGNSFTQPGKPGFFQEKFFAGNTKLGQSAGLTPLDTLQDVLNDYAKQSAQTISKNGMVRDLTDKLGARAITAANAAGAIRYADYGVDGAQDFLDKFPDFKDFSSSDLTGPYSTKEQHLIYNQATNDANQATLQGKLLGIDNPVARNLKDGSTVYLPKDINDIVTKTFNEGSTARNLPPKIQKALSAYDGFTRAYKTLITTPFIAFTQRNVVDNVFREVLDTGVYQAVRPEIARAAAEAAFNKGGEKVVELAGQDYTLNEVRDLASKYGVINTGEVAQGGLQGFRKVTDPFENTTRLQQFMLNIDRSGDIVTAANRTKQFQYDFSKLTSFERNVMQRLMPFYSFARQNVPFYLQQIAKQPAVFGNISKAYDQLQQNAGINDSQIPQYISDGFDIPLSSNNGEQSYLNAPGLSYEAANSSLQVGTKDGFLSNVAGQLNPALQAPLEILTKTNFFTGSSFNTAQGSDSRNEMAVTSLLNKIDPNDIDFSSGYVTAADGTKKFQATANPVINTILDSLPTTRIASWISNLERPDLTTGQKLLGSASSAKVTTVNGDQSAQTSQYYSAHDMVEQGLTTLQQMGYVKQKADNTYTVNMSFSSGDAATDTKMRVQALQLINAQSDPQDYIDSLNK